MKPISIFAVGRRGAELAKRIGSHLGGRAYVSERFLPQAGEGALPFGPEGVRGEIGNAWEKCRGLVLVLPLGAAVRLISPHLRDKYSDPAVVVVDEGGTHSISVLSGHVGGGNELARQVAAVVGAQPVITTASDVLGTLALVLLAKKQGWVVEENGGLTRASAVVVDGEMVGVFQEAGEEIWWKEAPGHLRRYSSIESLLAAPVCARLVISDRTLPLQPATVDVVFRPRTLVVGVGCVRGATAEEIEALLRQTLDEHGFAWASIRELATIDVKRDEEGITALAGRHGWPVRYFTAEELSAAGAPSGVSEEALRAVGAPGVCEPAALLAAKTHNLLVPKVRTTRVTVAVARVEMSAANGKLAIVGIGPGSAADVTERAGVALERADAIVGYDLYLDQVRPWIGPKTFYPSPIGEEEERCRLALELARNGQKVALVSSGDAGIYGMAGLVFELLANGVGGWDPNNVEVVPGVSAAGAAGAVLGAPFMSDYVTLSLSDLMIPWDVIERRIEAVGIGDFVVALYNPRSRRRTEQLRRAQEILLRHRSPETPVGIVRNASRPGQGVTLTDLERLLTEEVDMLSVVIIGNSATIRVGDRLVTRRGYGTDTYSPGTRQAGRSYELLVGSDLCDG